MEPDEQNTNIQLRNYMEEVVFRMLDTMLEQYQVCNCRQCRMDTAAYALNQLPPKYVVTEKGQMYSKLTELHQQMEVDVMMALIKGIEAVSKNPRHKGKEEPCVKTSS